MNTLIRLINNILLLFIGSLFFSCCLYSFKLNIKNFSVEKINGEILNIGKFKNNLIIICINNYYCKDCLKIIQKLKSKYRSFKLIFLIRVSKNEFAQKAKAKDYVEKELKKYNMVNPKIFFDIHSGEDPWPPKNLRGGIFGKYQIEKTPAYFILTKDTLIFKPYEEVEKELYWEP